MQTGVCLTSPKSDLWAGSGTFRVLVGVTGSVAALKLPLLVSQLLELPGVEVRVVTTEHAHHFYNPAEVTVKVYTDKDEWELWTQRSDPVLHIELRRWADLFVIAPLDANTLGKIASGICDNLLTCVVRAWDNSRPLLFCPAMNTAMWKHPITARQIASLKDFGYVEIPCIAKKLVCGDEDFADTFLGHCNVKLVDGPCPGQGSRGLGTLPFSFSGMNGYRSHGRVVNGYKCCETAPAEV